MADKNKSNFDFSFDQQNGGTHNDENVDQTTHNDENVDRTAHNDEDVNRITRTKTDQPQIPNDNAPFIVLCGPPASGKSMVLKSLASYLYEAENGYTIEANTTLRNTQKYQDDCATFNTIISSTNTPMPNNVDYLLADINDNAGNTVAHFLEAPGEDFFSINNSSVEPNRQFESYLYKVAQTQANSKRKVIFIILLDLDSKPSLRHDPALRVKYEQKMMKLYRTFVLHHPSRVILLYNKVDMPHDGRWANSTGITNPKAVYKDALRNYPNLFFKKKFLFWEIEDYTFLPYCTGGFPGDGSYTACGPYYPASLWKEITKRLW